jgi:glc operon protein GlcG
MPSSQLTHEAASTVMEAAMKKAEELGCVQQITIAITDAAGTLMSFLRMDHRWFQTEIATAKAFSAASFRRDGIYTGGQLDSRASWRTFPNLLSGKIALGPGGVLLRRGEYHGYHHGLGEDVLGAIGVSGAAPDQEETIAQAGAAAAIGLPQ